MKLFIKNCIGFIVIAFFILIYFICFGTAQVNGSSMFPTYEHGDFLFIAKLKQIEYNDIVAINSSDLDKLLCKRVIGVEGDHIVINKTGLYRNGTLLNEKYISNDLDWLKNTKKVDITVKKDEVFVLGDNRNASTDSRELGCLLKSGIYGVSVLNITDICGITRKDILYITAFLWILFVLSCIFCRKQTHENED